MTMHGLTSIPVNSNLMSDREICANHCLSMASSSKNQDWRKSRSVDALVSILPQDQRLAKSKAVPQYPNGAVVHDCQW